MKFTYDQILNLILLTIIFFLLFNMSDKDFFKKLYNFCSIFLNYCFNKAGLKYQLEPYLDFDDSIDFKKSLHSENSISSYQLIAKNNIKDSQENQNDSIDAKKNIKDSNSISNEKEIKSASMYYSENLDDKIAEHLYDFFQTLISHNENQIFVKSNKKIKPSEKQKNSFLKFIENKINSNDNYKFTNIEILNKLFYTSDDKIIEFKPIVLLMDYQLVYLNNKKKPVSVTLEGKVKIQIETFFEEDDPSTVFVSQNKFSNKHGNFKISRISILEFNKKINSDLPELIDSNLQNIDENSINLRNENDTNFNISTNPNKNKIGMIPNESGQSIQYQLTDSSKSDQKSSESYDILKISKPSQQNQLQKLHTNSITFQADPYSETINSLIPDRLDITESNSPLIHHS